MSSTTVHPSDLNINLLSIRAMEARPPLQNHKIKLTEQNDCIKKKLWNEVYVEMNGMAR